MQLHAVGGRDRGLGPGGAGRARRRRSRRPGRGAAARTASSRAGRSLMRTATNRTHLSCGLGHARRMRLVRQLAAVVLLPGTVAVLIPALLLGDAEIAPWPLALVGGAVLAFGLCMIAWTVALFAGVGRGTLAPWDPPERLVVRGPYRYVRNPMITGVVSVLLGEAALFGSPAGARLGRLRLRAQRRLLPARSRSPTCAAASAPTTTRTRRARRAGYRCRPTGRPVTPPPARCRGAAPGRCRRSRARTA